MSKAVFIASSHSTYNDRRGEAYHFPNVYLSRVARTVGDWVIFYQGRRGGVSGYYAVQRVERIVPDPIDPTHHYAILDRASELGFERTVPRFRVDGTAYETGLPLSRGSNTSSVRILTENDFAAIIDEGLREVSTPDSLPRDGSIPEDLSINPLVWQGFSARPQEAFAYLESQDRTKILGSRAFRDRAFARQVKAAYSARCAMSGLELRNGGGRPEVQAAHIVPVEERGPDIVENGMALSGTVHWMFDRGLVSVDEDLSLLISSDSVAHEIAERLFVPDRRLILPTDTARAPHPSYLKWHREHLFKG